MKGLAGVAAILALTLGYGDASVAHANGGTGGTYQVLACSQAPNDANHSWQPFDSDPSNINTGEVCPPIAGSGEPPKSTGLFATDILGSSGATPDGAIAGWRFVAPAGTAIVGLQDDRYLGAYADNGWVPFVQADSAVLETCSFTLAEEGCSVGEPFGSGSLDGTLPVSEASTLTVGIRCTAVGGCTSGATLHRAWAALYGAKVTLSTLSPPAIGNPSGSLWGTDTTGGFHKGTEQVSFAATDLTGIAKVTVSVDGRTVVSEEGKCDYTQPLPCQPLSAAFQINTTAFTDGPHTLTLNAYDAAGNETKISKQIVIANQAPLAPVGLKAEAQSAGGFLVSWSDPPDPTPIIGASYQLCPSSGNGCSNPTATGSDSPIALPANAAGQTVRVWLTDAAGNTNPGNAASVTLTASAITATVETTGSGRLLPLRVTHSLRGHRLTLVATAPIGVLGPIQFNIQALRGRTRLARISRRASVKHGRAVVVVVLSRSALAARRLSISASAKGAASDKFTVALRRAARRSQD